MDLTYSIIDACPKQNDNNFLILFNLIVGFTIFAIALQLTDHEKYLGIIKTLDENNKHLENRNENLRTTQQELLEQLEQMKNELESLQNLANQIPEPIQADEE